MAKGINNALSGNITARNYKTIKKPCCFLSGVTFLKQINKLRSGGHLWLKHKRSS
jgi:hypothetical protein